MPGKYPSKIPARCVPTWEAVRDLEGEFAASEVARTGIDPHEVSAALNMLRVRGLVERVRPHVWRVRR